MMYANIPNAVRKAIYRRDNFRCVLCDNTSGLQIHHVVHRGQGGSDNPQNLVTLCRRCHIFIHEHHTWCMGDEWSSADAEQACAEYLADFYTRPGKEWNPFTPEWWSTMFPNR